MCEQTVLLHVAGRPKPVMGDAEVEDQTPAPGLISKIVADLDVAAPLACAGRHAMLSADSVFRTAGQKKRNIEAASHISFFLHKLLNTNTAPITRAAGGREGKGKD